MHNIQQLFDDFQFFRKKTAHYKRLQQRKPYLRDMKLTEDRKAALERMTQWCQEHGLEPRWFLYSLFQARSWIASPLWDQLVPKTKKTAKIALLRYQNMDGAPLLRERVDHQFEQAKQGDFDINRDLSGTVENLKRRYVNDYEFERCMGEMQTRTFGFHPRSTVCVRCVARVQCEQRLQASVPFDIVALRRGEMTLDQAKRIAGRVYEDERRRS